MIFKISARNTYTGRTETAMIPSINRELALAAFQIHHGNHYTDYKINPL